MESVMPPAAAGQNLPGVASLATALRVGEEVFREALQKAPALPKLADVGRAPATLAEAISARDAKEEEKRRREAVRKDVKIKGKQVTPLPAVVEQAAPAPTPGLHIGNFNEASAFWMFVEDYFRDVTQEDIMALMPVALNPEEDDCLTVPFLGRDPRAIEQRTGPSKGKQGASREEDDTLEKQKRGRGASRQDLRFPDPFSAPGLPSPLLHTPIPESAPPSAQGSQQQLLQVTTDAIVQGKRPDGGPAAIMLDACTNHEARAFCMLAHKLGLLDETDSTTATVGGGPGALARGPQTEPSATAPPAFEAMDRAQLDALLLKISVLGDAEEVDCGRFQHLAGPAAEAGGAGAVTCAGPSISDTPAPAGPVAATHGSGPSVSSLAEDDTQSTNRGSVSVPELPRAACGDYMHPYLRSILDRPCTAYVLSPAGGTGSLMDTGQEDDDAPAEREERERTGERVGGRGRGRGRTPGGRGANRSARGDGSAAAASAGTFDAGMVAQMGGAFPGSGGLDPSAMSGMPGGNPHDQPLELQQLPPLPLQHQQPLGMVSDDGMGPAGGSGRFMPGSSPSFHSGATPGTGMGSASASAADRAAAARGGRARATVNYSALAGKKDKERERELREREKEERERARVSALPKMKRKPGPKAGASWSAGAGGAGGGWGSAGAALAGLQRPPTNNPVALLNKVPLLFKEEPGTNATTAAVHAIVAEGGPEGSLDQQWTQLDAATDIMAMAPDDEVLAELLALQSELVQQVAINRARVSAVMEAVIADLPQQRAANQQRAEWEEQIRVYLQRKAEVKRNLKREKRENEKRQALAALNEPNSPRGMVGRPKVGRPPAASASMSGQQGLAAYDSGAVSMMGGDAVEAAGQEAWRGATPGPSSGDGAAPMELGPVAEDFELVDPLALRTHDEEALCAICGDGLSLDPNMIVFCERCDVAVHQHCYGVQTIPAEEWLCWPCRLYEESQRAAGVPQNEIRPKRWEMEAKGITHAELPGGSLAVGCCLCPVRHGAFKRTTDGKAWCHVVCALWHEGPVVLPVDSPDAIESIHAIKSERWKAQCGICQRVGGAVAKCNFGHCQAYFHPLCGRRAGNYLVARIQPGLRTLRYRAYCHNHSEGQRAKDMQTGAAARPQPLEIYSPTVPPGGGGGRLGRRGAGFVGMQPLGSPMDGSEGGGFAAGGSASNLAGAMDMVYGEVDAAAACPPVKKRFGRPPKILKQQQLLQLQLTAANSPPPGVGSIPLPGTLPLLPSPNGPQPTPPTPTASAPDGSTVSAPMAVQSANQTGAAGQHLGGPPAGGAGMGDLGSPAVAGGPAGASAPRPPLPGSRLSLAAMAKRKAAAAAAGGAGAEAPGAEASGAAAEPSPYETRADAAGAGTGPIKARATTPTNSQQAAAGAGSSKPAGAKATSSRTSSGGGVAAAGGVDDAGVSGPGRGRARQSSSGAAMGPAGAVLGAGALGGTSSGPKPMRPKVPGAVAGVKEEQLEREGVGAAAAAASAGHLTIPPQTASAAEAAAAVGALTRARAAAAAAAGGSAGGGAGAPPVTMERLAELEHLRSMLGKWGPSSVRQELELVRTLADTVRRRERCKKAQYKLLQEALSAQSTQPEAVLQFFEAWNWQPTGFNPFGPRDRVEAPSLPTLDRLLKVHKGPGAGTGAGAPSAADDAAAGLDAAGRGTKRQRLPSAADSTERMDASGAGPSTSGGAAGGDGLPPSKRMRGAKSGDSAAAAFGGVGTSGQPGFRADPARSGPSTSSQQRPSAAGVMTGDELGEAASGGGRGRGGRGSRDAPPREIMTGRDWRRRVVMGPDGKWVPRPQGSGRGRGAGGPSRRGSTGAAGSRRSSGEAGYDLEDTEDDGDDVFEDAAEGFLEEGDDEEVDLDTEDEGWEPKGRAGALGGSAGRRRRVRDDRDQDLADAEAEAGMGEGAEGAAGRGRGGVGRGRAPRGRGQGRGGRGRGRGGRLGWGRRVIEDDEDDDEDDGPIAGLRTVGGGIGTGGIGSGGGGGGGASSGGVRAGADGARTGPGTGASGSTTTSTVTATLSVGGNSARGPGAWDPDEVRSGDGGNGGGRGSGGGAVAPGAAPAGAGAGSLHQPGMATASGAATPTAWPGTLTVPGAVTANAACAPALAAAPAASSGGWAPAVPQPTVPHGAGGSGLRPEGSGGGGGGNGGAPPIAVAGGPGGGGAAVATAPQQVMDTVMADAAPPPASLAHQPPQHQPQQPGPHPQPQLGEAHISTPRAATANEAADEPEGFGSARSHEPEASSQEVGPGAAPGDFAADMAALAPRTGSQALEAEAAATAGAGGPDAVRQALSAARAQAGAETLAAGGGKQQAAGALGAEGPVGDAAGGGGGAVAAADGNREQPRQPLTPQGSAGEEEAAGEGRPRRTAADGAERGGRATGAVVGGGEEAVRGGGGGGSSGGGGGADGSRRPSEERSENSDDASIAALSRQAVAAGGLPRQPRALMSQSTAAALNARLPKGYRFEKIP